MNNISHISATELRDLLLSLIALIIAFSILGEKRLPGYEMVLITAVGVGTGFLLHELAHKFVAMHYGYWAEYRANNMGLILAVVMAFAGFIFAAPGAVMITRSSYPGEFYSQDSISQEKLTKQFKREELYISLAGPLTNISLVAIFFVLLVSGVFGDSLWTRAANFALFINLILASFNLLPVGPLDGKKIFNSNRLVWAVVAIPTILLGLTMYLGII
jgi:Zn-dependent protease